LFGGDSLEFQLFEAHGIKRNNPAVLSFLVVGWLEGIVFIEFLEK
jgi:hypothetical protein